MQRKREHNKTSRMTARIRADSRTENAVSTQFCRLTSPRAGNSETLWEPIFFWQPARVLSARSAGARRLLFSRRFVETEEVLSLPVCSLRIKRSRLAALLHWFSVSTRRK